MYERSNLAASHSLLTSPCKQGEEPSESGGVA
jgi:hypothetical protein